MGRANNPFIGSLITHKAIAMSKLWSLAAGLAGALMLTCNTAWATTFLWGQPVTVTFYFLYGGTGGNVYIATSNNQNPDNCPHSNYIELASSLANFSQVFAAIVTAQASGQTVAVNYYGCSADGYPVLNGIAVPLIQ